MSGELSAHVQYTIFYDGREHAVRSVNLGHTDLDVSPSAVSLMASQIAPAYF